MQKFQVLESHPVLEMMAATGKFIIRYFLIKPNLLFFRLLLLIFNGSNLIRLFKRDGRDSKRELPTLEWASATLRFCFVCQFFLLPFDFRFLWWTVAQLKADFAMRIIRVWYFFSVHNIPAMKSEPSSQVNHTSRQRWTNTNVSLRIQLKNDVEILF